MFQRPRKWTRRFLHKRVRVRKPQRQQLLVLVSSKYLPNSNQDDDVPPTKMNQNNPKNATVKALTPEDEP